MLNKVVEQQEQDSLLVRLHNGTATLEQNLVFSYKTKQTLTTQPSNCTPWYLSERAEKLR